MTITEAGTTMVPADLIDAGSNDRQHFDETELAALAASIAEHGLAQPPTLRPNGDRFQIVAGERRCRAMRDVLGWTEIPALVRELDDETAAAIMLIENVQRADLDPIEEAAAYRARIDRYGLSVAEVARMATVPASRVRSRIALLSLSDRVAHWVRTKALPLSFAALMVQLDANRQELALAAYNASPLTIDAMRALCARLQAEQDADPLFDPATFFQIEEYAADATAAVQERDTVDEMDADPVGAIDIAARLGVEPVTVKKWQQRGTNLRGGDAMPPPRWVVAGNSVWQWTDVEAWARRTGRLTGDYVKPKPKPAPEPELPAGMVRMEPGSIPWVRR